MPRPRVFVLGDSISIQYGPYLESCGAPFFGYSRKTGEEEALKDLDHSMGANGGDSSMVLEYLRAMERAGGLEADILLLNCGLHDTKTDPKTGAKQVPLDAYEKNLREVLDVVKKLGVALVWVSTTPVDDTMHDASGRDFQRRLSDVQSYNRAAETIMRAAGVPIADLYSFTSSVPGDLFEDGVHFRESVRPLQAAFLVGYLSR